MELQIARLVDPQVALTPETVMTRRPAQRAKKTITESASGLQSVIDSAEEVLESFKDQQGAAAERIRERISATLDKARQRLDDLDVPELASDAVEGAVGFVKDNPWRTVAIGALAILTASFVVRGLSDH